MAPSQKRSRGRPRKFPLKARKGKHAPKNNDNNCVMTLFEFASIILAAEHGADEDFSVVKNIIEISK